MPSSDNDLESIRELIRNLFSPAELRRLCLDYGFKEITFDFKEDASINDMTDTVLGYCERNALLDELLIAMARERPVQFAPFEARIYKRRGPNRESQMGIGHWGHLRRPPKMWLVIGLALTSVLVTLLILVHNNRPDCEIVLGDLVPAKANPCPGEQVSITAHVQKSCDSALTYSWSTFNGEVDPIGPTIENQTDYTAPGHPVKDTVRVIVQDANDRSADAEVSIQVIECTIDDTLGYPTRTPETEAETYSVTGRVLVQSGSEKRSPRGGYVTLYADPNPIVSGDESVIDPLHPVQLSKSGHYSFTGVASGQYLVRVELDEGECEVEAGSFGILVDRDDYIHPDVVVARCGKIFGQVWLDKNQNGRRDEYEEAGLGQVLALYRDSDGSPDGSPWQTADLYDGTYSFDNLSPKSCYVLGFQEPCPSAFTAGGCVVHVCLRDILEREVSFGYDTGSRIDVASPYVCWWLIESSECNEYQMLTDIVVGEGSNGLKLLRISGKVGVPANTEFDGFKLDYRVAHCIPEDWCWKEILASSDSRSSPVAEWGMNGLPSGTRVKIRLRTVGSGVQDDGCKAWVILP